MIKNKKRIELRERILKPLIESIPIVAFYEDELAKYATYIEELIKENNNE